MWIKNILKRRRILFAILPRLKKFEVPDLIFFHLIFTASPDLQSTVQNSDHPHYRYAYITDIVDFDNLITAEENLRSETLEEGVNGHKKMCNKRTAMMPRYQGSDFLQKLSIHVSDNCMHTGILIKIFNHSVTSFVQKIVLLHKTTPHSLSLSLFLSTA